MAEVVIGRCKVCHSPHRAQIEQWVKQDGVRYREVERRLAEMGESISNPAIGRHFREHFDVPAAVREQYQQSQAVMQEAVEKRLSDLEILDSVIQGNHSLHQQARAWLTDILKPQEEPAERRVPRPPMSLVALHEKTAAEIRQAMRTKLELLGDDPASKQADALDHLTNILQAVWVGEDVSE